MATGAPLPVREFASAVEMRAHYDRLWGHGGTPARHGPAAFIPPKPVTPLDMAALSAATVITVGDCLAVASRLSGVGVKDIRSNSKIVRFVKARQTVFWLANRFTRASMPKIGRLIGDRDHTTVLHGCRRVESVIGVLGLYIWDDLEDAARIILAADWPPIGVAPGTPRVRPQSRARPC